MVWRGSWVRWAVAALVVALIGWIWRSWTNPKGLVDLHVLKNRNFRTGCFLIALLGMCIYITITILPLYYQEVMGYTAFTAGLVVGPRGVGFDYRVPGDRHSRVADRQPQTADAWDSSGSGSARCIFGMVNLDIGPYTLLIPIMLTGFALSFVFVPLATMTTATLSREEMGNATGLFNMLRNIGGSIGIAMATTAIIRRAALHQTEIGANLTASSAVLQQKSAMMSTYLEPSCGPRAGAAGVDGDDLRPDAAAVGADGLCGCFSLDGAAGVFLRVGSVALQKAAEACGSATGSTLKSAL